VGLPDQGSVRALVPADPLTSAARDLRARDEARVGLYVHVPFCAARCTYCDFSSGPVATPAIERYLAALEREIELRAPAARDVTFTSVFFGGGTPSALPAASFDRVARALRGAFDIAHDAEITLEANPESVRDDRLEAWARFGVNRLSFGAQSFATDELRLLGRIHDAARPSEAARRARTHGFRRLSLDLMYGFPGHDAERWARTIDAALALDTEHVSAYCFIPEPGTSLGDAALEGRRALPADDAQADAYEQLVTTLERHGHACYETSNFCRPDAEARHNLVYWLRRPYLGLGPSAHGLWEGRRYGNHYALTEWASALERDATPEAECEHDDATSRAREIVMLGLRLSEGLRRADHAAGAWGEVVERYDAAFERALATGRLERRAGRLAIPRSLRFVADDVIAWIEAEADRAARGPNDARAFDSVGRRSLTWSA
jgi:oxygen-independent coproporphyrinogen-3 oxidase